MTIISFGISARVYEGYAGGGNVKVVNAEGQIHNTLDKIQRKLI
jgi:hypothetical protein